MGDARSQARPRRAQSGNPSWKTENRSKQQVSRANLSNSAHVGSIWQIEQVHDRGDAEVSRIARLQHGQIHRSQLLACGIGRAAIAHRLKTGRLERVFPSVYQVWPPADRQHGRLIAAALRFQGDALISGRAAADLWGMLDVTLRPQERDPIDVLLVGRSAHPVPGLRLHRVRSIAHRDLRWRHGIPVVSPARALLALSGELKALELESALFAALDRRVVRLSQVREVLLRNPLASGAAVLRGLIDAPGELRDTRSRYERRLLHLLRESGLPAPALNVALGGHDVDMYWPDLNLVIEFDGWEFHRGRRSFEHDRLRDQDLVSTGRHVMRVTARQIDGSPLALIARIATAVTTLRLSR